MTTNDIDAIRSRAHTCDAYRHRWANELGVGDRDVIEGLRAAKELVADDVPALCDEVEQLREALGQIAGMCNCRAADDCPSSVARQALGTEQAEAAR